MAGTLDTVYLAAAVLVAVAGLGVIAGIAARTDVGTPTWFEGAALAVAALFLVALGAEFLA